MLFYKIDGSIRDVSTMTITPIEIYLKDIGDHSTTGFKYGRDCMEFIMDNQLEDYKHGYIHSHHSMSVFFSGTDVEELQDNVANHNIYFSLVVNNFMDMAAKTTFVATPKLYTCPDQDGETYEYEVEGIDPVMMVYDCKIEQPAEEIVVGKGLMKNLQEVRMIVNKRNEEEAKRKAEELKKKAEAAKANPIMAVSKAPGDGGGGYGSHGYPQNYTQNFHESNKEGEIDDVEPDYDDFFAYCFNGGAHTQLDTDDMIKSIDKEKSSELVVDMIMSNYATYYQNYFEVDKYGIDSDEFTDTIGDFIDLCDFGQEDFPWLDTLMEGLVQIRNKFESLNLNQKVNGHAEA